MSFARRSVAALCGAFLLQLMLLGSGTLCGMHPAPAGAASSAHGMNMGMMHATSSHESTVASAGESGTPVTPDATRGHDGCPLPFAPGQCSSMTTCNLSATPAAIVARFAHARTIAVVMSSLVPRHSGPTFAPELPPPRV